jgi:diguanylate cyclase (GGDEF)-like protein
VVIELEANRNSAPTFLIAPSHHNTKIKITRLVSYLTSVVAFIYTLFFWLVLDQSLLAAMNSLFTLAYCITLLLIYFNRYYFANVWFFSVLIGHVFILTTQIFTPETGFHFYYLLLPTSVFILLGEKEKLAKVVITLIGTGLFFICEHYPSDPIIMLSKQAETWMFSSTILVIIIEITVVMYIYSNTILMRENELEEMASVDSLTGLHNRRVFVELAEQILANAQRYNKYFSVVIMDIDFFKKINDNYGHSVGDKTLRMIAELLKTKVRKSDVLARYGGEEFILLLPDTNVQEAYEVAESIRSVVETFVLSVDVEINISCTLSLGVAQYHNGTTSLSEVVRLADEALYRAKDNGRNCVCL